MKHTLPPTNMEVQKALFTFFYRKVVFLQGSVHFNVSWWEGMAINFESNHLKIGWWS